MPRSPALNAASTVTVPQGRIVQWKRSTAISSDVHSACNPLYPTLCFPCLRSFSLCCSIVQLDAGQHQFPIRRDLQVDLLLHPPPSRWWSARYENRSPATPARARVGLLKYRHALSSPVFFFPEPTILPCCSAFLDQHRAFLPCPHWSAPFVLDRTSWITVLFTTASRSAVVSLQRQHRTSFRIPTRTDHRTIHSLAPVSKLTTLPPFLPDKGLREHRSKTRIISCGEKLGQVEEAHYGR